MMMLPRQLLLTCNVIGDRFRLDMSTITRFLQVHVVGDDRLTGFSLAMAVIPILVAYVNLYPVGD